MKEQKRKHVKEDEDEQNKTNKDEVQKGKRGRKKGNKRISIRDGIIQEDYHTTRR